jgi:hypothetical protein
MKTSEILYKAVDVLDERGWCQCYYRDHGGRVCVASAIHLAAGGTLMPRGTSVSFLHDGPAKSALAFFGAVVTGGCIEAFNNEDGAKKRDMKAALEIAADIAAAEGR